MSIAFQGQVASAGLFETPADFTVEVADVRVPTENISNNVAAFAGFEGDWRVGANGATQRNNEHWGSPRFNGAAMFRRTVAGVNNITLLTEDDGASAGPFLDLDRKSASPAASDIGGNLRFLGRDSAGNATAYGAVRSIVNSPTDGAEAGQLDIQTMQGGALATAATVKAGVQVGAPTGGDKGAGTVNATGFYRQGTELINYVHPNHSGDVTSAGDGATTIAANAVLNAMLADMAQSTIKGRAAAAGTGDPTDLTAAQVKTILAIVSTDIGDFTEASQDVIGALLVTAGDLAWTYDDVGNTLSAVVANNAITLAKMADMATASFLGRNTAATGDPEVLSVATAKTMLNLTGTNSGDQTIALTGDVTGSGTGSFAATIAADAVSYAKLQNVSAAQRVLGRSTAGAGDPEEVTASQLFDWIGSTQGSVLYRGATGWAALTPGASGEVLKTQGAGANPIWGTAAGSGDVAGPAAATDNAVARFDAATGKLIQNSGVLVADDGSMQLPEVTAPAAAAADTVNLFGFDVGARGMAGFRAASGLASPLQPLLARNKVALWNAAGNTTSVPGVFGMTGLTALGTATARNVTTTNLFTRSRRLGYVSAATAGNFAGNHISGAQYTIGDGTSLGGFHHVIRFGVSDAAAVSGARMFVGLRNVSTTPTNVEPNTLTNVAGVAKLSTSNNLQIVYGGSAAQTAIDLGANFPANTLSADAYELSLFAPVNSQVIHYRVERLNTGDVASGTLSGAVGTAIPAASTFLGHTAWRCNNATALAVGIDISSIYIESDN